MEEKEYNKFEDKSVAEEYDLEPERIKKALAVSQAILKEIKLTKLEKVIDFGAGTGLITFHLQPFATEITAVDCSGTMLDELQLKINKNNIKNIKILKWNIEEEYLPLSEIDLVASSMTMHHIPDSVKIIRRLAKVLKTGGCLAVADLDTENGDFHPDNTGVFHFGFDRGNLRYLVENEGFMDIRFCTPYKINKETAEGIIKKFPVFLLTAVKK